MSATRRDTSGVFDPIDLKGAGATISVSPERCRISANGIEFHSATSIPEMTEMTIEVSSEAGTPVSCKGVVVGSHGNEEMGYSISFLFVGLPPASLSQLEQLSLS